MGKRGGKKKKSKGGGNGSVESVDLSVNDSSTSIVDVVNLDGSSLVDVVGNSSTGISGLNSTSDAQGESIDIDIGQVKEEGQSDEEVAAGLTSFHTQVSSPIGNPEKALEASFLDVSGDDELRGSGTPPDSVAGARVHRSPHDEVISADGRVDVFQEESGEARPLLSGERASYDGTHLTLNIPDQAEGTRKKVRRKKTGSNSKELRKLYLSLKRKIWLFTIISLLSNVLLFGCKIYISIKSRSLAVMASAIDSFLDLVSQLIIYYVLRGQKAIDEEKYPVGRNRLEPIGIIVCASLMGIASLQLVAESLKVLFRGTFGGESPDQLVPDVGVLTVGLLGSAIIIKGVLFVPCSSLSSQSDSMMVLAEDHRNDVLSNSVALFTAYLSNKYQDIWWFDPVGGIVIAIYICVMWMFVAQEQAGMLEGVAAEPTFLKEVRELANTFHEKMYVDVVRAYHFGKRYLVEVEVVLPGNMVVVQAHDISLELQKKIERLENVERAFVHVDYMTRDEDEHKVTYYQTPQTTPSIMRDDEEASVSSSIDIDEEIQVLGDVYNKAVPQTIKRHVHITQHHHKKHNHLEWGEPSQEK
mmetsp:Transcript_9270/g.15064  ORF Transcript_9270/g.15064 Transcript_9270/m.15064 type:complete len:584 (+) Transcript_9270:100-1851(+)